MYLLFTSLTCAFTDVFILPDPRDDLGGMDVARKVRCLLISNLLSGVLFVIFFYFLC